MAESGVRVIGLRQVVRTLERYGVEASDLKAAFKRIGTMVGNEAKGLAPQLSGALANSIRPSNTKNRSIVRAGSAKVPYAGVVHYGGGVSRGSRGPHNISPHPFLTDAVENKQAAAIDAMEDELNALIRKLDLK